ncbi:MAG: MFS transporter [Sedimentisphaerales bacterium]|nr:MFS transporter [Sedimentisphaerales bacterium]
MNLSENKFARLFTLCAMYAAQGIPFGFVTRLLASYLVDEGGYDTAVVGKLTAIVTLPWVIKWIWGPVIDRYTYRPMGRRRPWILFAQLFMVITIAAMLLIPDVIKNINTLLVLVFINNVFASLQDVSVDALAVELLEEKERGLANGLMYGSASAGAAFSSIVLAHVKDSYGLRTAMAVQAAVLCLIMFLPLLLKERRGEKLLPWTKGKPMDLDKQETMASIFQFLVHLKAAFSIRSAFMMIFLALFIKVAVDLHGVVSIVYYIKEMGWTDVESSDIRGKVDFFALLGCFLGGFIADRLGHKKIAISATILFGASYIIFASIPSLWAIKMAVKIFFAVEGALYGALAVAFFAMCMDVSLPLVAGTQFTAYMSLSNLSSTLGCWMADWFYKRMDYGQILIFWGIFHIVVITIILLFINPRQRIQTLEDSKRELLVTDVNNNLKENQNEKK